VDGGDVRHADAEDAMRAERVAVRGANSCESDAGGDGLTRRALICGQEKSGLGAMVALAARWRALAPSPVLS
jgi:hypothetical protein